MPVRTVSGEQYFYELAHSAEKYFIPYLRTCKEIGPGLRVLEFGCGQGGILLPFAKMGCEVTGVDLDATKIEAGRQCFEKEGAQGNLIASDLFKIKDFENYFDVIICHDIIEHIGDKQGFMEKIRKYIKDDGVIFFGFPAWQMPFGGHQQNCKSRFASHCPFLHLLPAGLYKWVLQKSGESEGTIREMLEIKDTRTPVELFQRTVRRNGLHIVDRTLYLINPHYEIKFHMKPRKLWKWVAAIPWLRNFFSTSCFYLVTK